MLNYLTGRSTWHNLQDENTYMNGCMRGTLWGNTSGLGSNEQILELQVSWFILFPHYSQIRQKSGAWIQRWRDRGASCMDAVNGWFDRSAIHCLLHQPLQKRSLFFMNSSSLSELAPLWQKAFVPFNSNCILKHSVRQSWRSCLLNKSEFCSS